MPILRYFCWIGAGLLVLLFLADSQLPKVEERAEPLPRDLNIRIAAPRTGPDAVSFSGPTVTHQPAPPMQVVDFAARAARAEAANAKAADAKVTDARATDAKAANAKAADAKTANAKTANAKAANARAARARIGAARQSFAQVRPEVSQQAAPNPAPQGARTAYYARRNTEYARRRVEPERPRFDEPSRFAWDWSWGQRGWP